MINIDELNTCLSSFEIQSKIGNSNYLISHAASTVVEILDETNLVREILVDFIHHSDSGQDIEQKLFKIILRDIAPYFENNFSLYDTIKYTNLFIERYEFYTKKKIFDTLDIYSLYKGEYGEYGKFINTHFISINKPNYSIIYKIALKISEILLEEISKE